MVLKLSGEVLGGASGKGLDADTVRSILDQIKEVADLGTEIGIVIGGGNVLRGGQAADSGLGRVTADYIGMLGTIINGLALRDLGNAQGLRISVMSSLPGSGFVESYGVESAITHLKEGRIVVFAGGTGNPFLTTDTAAALRAAEIGADVLVKATKVDGVYSADPMVDENAKRFDRISFADAMKQELGFMDGSALWICSQVNIPIVVFNIREENGLKRVALGEQIGTVVGEVPHD
jgi:uridylate kinase